MLRVVAVGDQWGSFPCEEMILVRKCRKQSVVIVLEEDDVRKLVASIPDWESEATKDKTIKFILRHRLGKIICHMHLMELGVNA